jgi:hypothetical protein
VDDASFDLDVEERGGATEKDRVDGEEVSGHNALGLGAQEFGPGWSDPSWRRWEPMTGKDVATLALETVTPSFFSSPTMRG